MCCPEAASRPNGDLRRRERVVDLTLTTAVTATGSSVWAVGWLTQGPWLTEVRFPQ
jgi:hypothetical protein